MNKILNGRRLTSFIAMLSGILGSTVIALSTPPPGMPDTAAWTINFERGGTENPYQAFWLDSCIAVLRVMPQVNIDIVTYGDLGDTIDSNIEIAGKRGQWAFQHFTGAGIAAKRIRIVNKGGLEAGRDAYQLEIWYR